MSNLYPPPVKIDMPVSVDRSKSLAILKWANYQQSLESLEAKLASLVEETKAYQRAIIERRLQIAAIEKELLGEKDESTTRPDAGVNGGQKQPE